MRKGKVMKKKRISKEKSFLPKLIEKDEESEKKEKENAYKKQCFRVVLEPIKDKHVGK